MSITTPIRIQAVPIFDDNYVWLIIHEEKKQAIAIDIGDAPPVLDFLRQAGLILSAIWVTHHHHDHIGGVVQACEAFADVCVHAHTAHLAAMHLPDGVAVVPVVEGVGISAWGKSVAVWETFGHTDSHLSYVLDLEGAVHVFCGDTLFSAGCGRIFAGTYEQMYDSLQRYLRLPDDAYFYPAHEYTLSNLKFCAHIEPNNAKVQRAISALTSAINTNPKHISLPVQLKDERAINVFLRTDVPSVIASVQDKVGLDGADGLAIFRALRILKNTF